METNEQAPLKLIINDKEIAHFLLALIDYQKLCEHISIDWKNSAEAVVWWSEKKREDGGKFDPDKWKDKLLQKIKKGIEADLSEFYQRYSSHLDALKGKYYESIHANIEYFIDALGEEKIFELYKIARKQNFVKSVGSKISQNIEFIRRKKFNEFDKDCLIRNTVGNENLLISKIDNKYPFWFIDSGYTNFLEFNKKWHRLVRNHLHQAVSVDCPADRLKYFQKFPKPWRTDGDVILVIEPGPFAAGIFHVDVQKWKKDLVDELRKHTDKKIKFREKAPKTERDSLYEILKQDNWYCVISINSNAATEAIWQGLPAITLDRHITNRVTRSKLSDINDLYRGPIGDWLCMLSYSQFTYDELITGKALNIVSNYHAKN
jgi:hypothetical protein